MRENVKVVTDEHFWLCTIDVQFTLTNVGLVSRLSLKEKKKNHVTTCLWVFFMQLCTQNNLQPVSIATQSAAPAVVFDSCWLERLLKLDVVFNPVGAAETLLDHQWISRFGLQKFSVLLLIHRNIICCPLSATASVLFYNFPQTNAINNVRQLRCSQIRIASCSPRLRSGVCLSVIKTSSWKLSHPVSLVCQFLSTCMSDACYYWSDLSLFFISDNWTNASDLCRTLYNFRNYRILNANTKTLLFERTTFNTTLGQTFEFDCGWTGGADQIFRALMFLSHLSVCDVGRLQYSSSHEHHDSQPPPYKNNQWTL